MNNSSNEIVHNILLMAICILFGFVIHSSIQEWSNNETVTEPEVITEYVYVEAEPEVIIETVYVPCEMDEFLRNLSEEDEWYLMDMGMREAENQGVVGHCWVMYTVLCRCEAYGKTIKEVCESSAFESSKSRSGFTPNDDCKKALELIKEGWTPKPLWFRKSYYHGFGNPLCQYGDHCFSMK